MSFLKNLQKTIKSHHLLALLGIVVVLYAIYQYSDRKGSSTSGFNNNDKNVPTGNNGVNMSGGGFAVAANPAGQNEDILLWFAF